MKPTVSRCLALVLLTSLYGCGDSSEPGDRAEGGAGGRGGAPGQLGGSSGRDPSNGGVSASGGGGANTSGRAGAGGGLPGNTGDAGSSGGSAAGGSSGGPGIPGDIRLIDLTPAQAAVLCDWYAAMLGGYGHVAECPGGPRPVFQNQAQCLMIGFDYDCPPITVANLAECIEAQAPSQGCSVPYEHCHWLNCM